MDSDALTLAWADALKAASNDRPLLAGNSRSPDGIVRRLMNRQGNCEHRDCQARATPTDQGTREKVT